MNSKLTGKGDDDDDDDDVVVKKKPILPFSPINTDF